MGIVKSRPSTVKKKYALEARIFELIVLTIRDPSTAGEGLNALIQELKLSLPTLNQSVALNLYSNIMVELFADSNPMNSTKPGEAPLGALAESMVIHFTSINEE